MAVDGGREPKISVVVPVYKEEQNIGPFLERLRPVLEEIGDYEILFCLDPSPDRTEQIIMAEGVRDTRVGLLTFSRRFGQPAATIAGIMNCRGETCVIIDVDLQDPPELITRMYRELSEGFDVVTARRSSRKGETWVKQLVAKLGYDLINRIAEVTIPRDTGDFRIMTRRVIEEMRHLGESHGFLRGLVALVGFRQTFVDYERDARFAGTGNYNRYFGSLKIGFNGIFGFSTFPLSLTLWTGFAVVLISLVLAALFLAVKLFGGTADFGDIPVITVLVLFMGGVQLMAVGVLGEYVGRIYDEVRRRPQFIIDRALNVTIRDPRGPRSGTLGGVNPG